MIEQIDTIIHPIGDIYPVDVEKLKAKLNELIDAVNNLSTAV